MKTFVTEKQAMKFMLSLFEVFFLHCAAKRDDRKKVLKYGPAKPYQGEKISVNKVKQIFKTRLMLL